MDDAVGKILIFLLEEDMKKEKLGKEYLSEESYRSHNKIFQEPYKRAKEKGLIQEEKGEKSGRGRPPTVVSPNWRGISEWLFENYGLDTEKTEDFAEDLAESFEEHRKILFNLDAFEELYSMDGEYEFPRLGGFINTAIGYLSVLVLCLFILEEDGVETVEEALSKIRDYEKDNKTASSVRFMVWRVWRDLTDKNKRNFEERELKFIRKQLEACDSYDEVRPIRDDFFRYFRYIEGYIGRKDIEIEEEEEDYSSEDLLKAIEEGAIYSYKPLVKGIRIPINDANKKEIQKDSVIFKAPQDLEEFETWLNTRKLFE